MNTSYFGKYRGYKGISIAIKHPNWFKGPVYPKLYPHRNFLFEYKRTKNEQVYTREYTNKVLIKLFAMEVYEELEDYTLLCWEKSGEFCHRRLVAEWIQNHMGIEVPEL